MRQAREKFWPPFGRLLRVPLEIFLAGVPLVRYGVVGRLAAAVVWRVLAFLWFVCLLFS